jgi:hypothetical protein
MVVVAQTAGTRGLETPHPRVSDANEVQGVEMGWGRSKTGGVGVAWWLKNGGGGGWADAGSARVGDPPASRLHRKRGAGNVNALGVVENRRGWGGQVVEKRVVLVGWQMPGARSPETPRLLVFTGNEVRGV